MSSYVITKLIKQAELSKAKLLRPSGEQYDYSRDDDFYHFMAHIDKGLQEKIRKGEFIQLNKLLVRRKPILNQESRLDIVNRSGRSFLVPNNERELLSINSFKRWEETFHIYSGIYTMAHPHHANEIPVCGHHCKCCIDFHVGKCIFICYTFQTFNGLLS